MPKPTKIPPQFIEPVGVFVQEEMDARGWSQEKMAVKMGATTEDEAMENYAILDFLLCDPPIDGLLLGEDAARKLETAFGASAQFWLKLDASYRAAQSAMKDKDSTHA